MSKLEELIKEFCPNGVIRVTIGKICKISRGIVMSKDFIRDNHGDYPVYSSQTENNGCLGYINTYKYDGEYVTWTTDGANAGTVFYRSGKFSITNVCGLLEVKDLMVVNTKYLYYALSIEARRYVNQGMGNPKLMSNIMASVQIPLPALPVQREIVRILDSFTLYSAELTAELTARRKQYEFYRDKLLNFGNAKLVVKNKKLKELCMSIKDGMHNLPVTTDENTGYPVLSAMNIYDGQIHYDAKRFVSREVFEQESKRTKIETGDVLLTIVATIGRTAVVENSTSFLLQRSVCALKPSKEILSKYLKYYLDTNAIQNYIFANAHGSAQAGLYLNQVADIEVVLPPMEVQERIVKVLDNFDAICSDLGIGLPAEIEKRQKQYEYYREKLLTFDGKYATILTERNGTERNGTERNGTGRAD